MEISNAKKYAVYAICLGGGVTAVTLALFLFKPSTPLEFAHPIDTFVFAHYGALIGGVVGTLFSLAAVLLLIHNLQNQDKTNLKQEIERRFFELLKIHIANSNGIDIQDQIGKRNFIDMMDEFTLAAAMAICGWRRPCSFCWSCFPAWRSRNRSRAIRIRSSNHHGGQHQRQNRLPSRLPVTDAEAAPSG